MYSTLPLEILKLSVSERIQLVEDIWDSVILTPDAVQLTEAQRKELDRRLSLYKQNPSAVSSWDEVRQRINQSR